MVWREPIIMKQKVWHSHPTGNKKPLLRRRGFHAPKQNKASLFKYTAVSKRYRRVAFVLTAFANRRWIGKLWTPTGTQSVSSYAKLLFPICCHRKNISSTFATSISQMMKRNSSLKAAFYTAIQDDCIRKNPHERSRIWSVQACAEKQRADKAYRYRRVRELPFP